MVLSKKLNERREINKQIRKLFAQKKAIDDEIIDYIEFHDEEIEKLDIDNELELYVLYQDKIDYKLVRELHPEIYNAGQVLIFKWEHAIQMFENKKEFWQVINDCKVKEKKLKISRK